MSEKTELKKGDRCLFWQIELDKIISFHVLLNLIFKSYSKLMGESVDHRVSRQCSIPKL